MQRNLTSEYVQNEVENFFGVNPEELAVKRFLCESAEIKNIYRIYLQEPEQIYRQDHVEDNHKKAEYRSFLNELKNAKTFHDLDNATDKINIEKYLKERPDDKFASTLGVTGIKAVLNVGSFFSTEANFALQARRFREALVKHMEKNNYFFHDKTLNNNNKR